MISIGVDAALLRDLTRTLNNIPKDMRKQLAIAVNKTAKKTESHMAKQITSEVNVPQKVVKRVLVTERAASGETEAKVTLSKTKQLNVADFRPNQTKNGVTYKISKTGKSRSRIPNAFIVNKYGGQVYVRKTKGKGSGRGPLARKRGPSPWGVFTKNNYTQPTKKQTQIELRKQVVERIRFLKLKKAGVI